MKKRLFVLFVGLLLVSVGAVLSLPPILQARQNAAVPKVAQSPFEKNAQQEITASDLSDADAQRIEGLPVRIQIPSLSIDLLVAKGYHNTQAGTWTLSKDKAQYAVDTPLANTLAGNTFIYGHNRREVFRDLAKIKLGAEAFVVTDNGHTFTYIFKGALETTPNDGTLFAYQGPPIMTVQTCSGAWYQNRQLFTFELKEAR